MISTGPWNILVFGLLTHKESNLLLPLGLILTSELPPLPLPPDQPTNVDEKYLKQLQDSLASAQREVEENLKPRFTDMEEQEAAMRRRLTGMNADIESILWDVANLREILNSIPNGCFNSPPIEQP